MMMQDKLRSLSAVPVDIKGCDNLGERHVGRDGSWHAHLVDLQVGVGGDDGSGREVHTFAHQIAPHSPLFSL